ncbi:methylmalonyl-CoA mutase family protein, partial [Salibacter sp.]|uniref:methylmalonyl-CoA mutase family protein n=1 Tax=Salibacter sp. TaxID=2010995 RepID=UPI00287046B0
SLYYETLKHNGDYPIIGVNTFLSSEGSPTVTPGEIIRATKDEKEAQIDTVNSLKDRQKAKSEEMIKRVQESAIQNQNIFAELMEACKYCSLGEITEALFEVGGQYRRNM